MILAQLAFRHVFRIIFWPYFVYRVALLKAVVSVFRWPFQHIFTFSFVLALFILLLPLRLLLLLLCQIRIFSDALLEPESFLLFLFLLSPRISLVVTLKTSRQHIFLHRSKVDVFTLLRCSPRLFSYMAINWCALGAYDCVPRVDRAVTFLFLRP